MWPEQGEPREEGAASGDATASALPRAGPPRSVQFQEGAPRIDDATSSKPRLWSGATDSFYKASGAHAGNDKGQLSPAAADRVFPIRSVVSVDPTPTPSQRPERPGDSYFSSASQARRQSINSTSDTASLKGTPGRSRQPSKDESVGSVPEESHSQQASTTSSLSNASKPRHPAHYFNELASGKTESDSGNSRAQSMSSRPISTRSLSMMSQDDTGTGLVTARFKHAVFEGGHAVITGRDGDTLQRCEDEPIHIPGAVQGFGLLIALEEESEGKLVVRVVSENSKKLIGYSPRQLFALDSFTDILSEEQADNLLDHIDFIKDEETDVVTNGPEVFTISIRTPHRMVQKLWCAMHINHVNTGLIICEFELEDDPYCPLVPPNDATPEPPEDTLNSDPTPQEYAESTQNTSRPLRVLRSARKRKGEAAAMEVFNIMSQVQEQLAAAPNLDKFLKILVGVVKELTGFHRVMVYQFDSSFNGRVVTELVDPRATKDLYKGLNFPASDIPKQARDLYKINKVRMLYDRDQETARLVCRTVEDLETPLDLTYSYLRAMSPIHIKYLANMAVRSSMSISINAFDELWGLIACHSYGGRGTRVSFPIRKMCRLVGDSASRNIERLSYASRLQARKLINTVPTQTNPSGYIIASSEDLLKLFDADFGVLSIRDETKILGHLEQSHEVLAMLEYLRMRKITNVMTSQDIFQDFPDLRYAPGFKVIAGLLLVPLSAGGHDFIVFFRKGQLREVKWAGNPYEKFIKAGTEGYLEPRKSFKTWSEKVIGKCREWTEEEIETAAVLCLVYGKFIEVWRQKEAALQSSQLTRLLLANSAHEVRTPLNAIINYLEIALEGSLDSETRENLTKSHSASKSLIYVINDLLDLTKTEEGGELVKDEVFDLQQTLLEATDAFRGDARRKEISYEVVEHPGLPQNVLGDQRKVRQAISNITANAIQNTIKGGVKIEAYPVVRENSRVEIEISVTDTGTGMSSKKLDALFRELEQVQSEGDILADHVVTDSKVIEGGPQKEEDRRVLGLGLAVVARIVRNMNGQLRLKSEEGRGSRFVVQLPFILPEDSAQKSLTDVPASGTDNSSLLPRTPLESGEVTLIDRGSTFNATEEGRSPLSRQSSTESLGSARGSLRSVASLASQASARSEADRLIDAISKPTNEQRSRSSHSAKAGGNQRSGTLMGSSGHEEVRQRSKSIDLGTHFPPRKSSIGTATVQDQGTPVRALRVPDGVEGSSPVIGSNSGFSPRFKQVTPPEQRAEPPTANHMNVLVAEDDPVNSKIIKKRLDKLGHETYLTVNGEECSSIYGERSDYFDVVLMDMQMPIVDGLTATKMIRSFEKSHPTHLLSSRASLNGRVPIIAVSASLIERERQNYIDAGFDGWILKPIPFVRLSEIMSGIVDKDARKKNLYRAGAWEQGGWFEQSQRDVFAADTSPNDEMPMSGPSKGARIAAVSDDPFTKEDDSSRQTLEQKRMAGNQQRERDDDPTLSQHAEPQGS